MNIGVLKERKTDERRVALMPKQVSVLIEGGHKIYIERGAGTNSGYSDAAYQENGAIIAEQSDVYKYARLLLKVKCPLQDEYRFLSKKHILFTYLHFDENISQQNITTLINSKASMISYEWVEDNGHYPLLQPMSELTGAVFARKSIDLLMTNAGLLGGQYNASWERATAMVIGAGNIGLNAMNVFLRNNYKVIVIDKHPETLRERMLPLMGDLELENGKVEIVKFDESNSIESVNKIRLLLPTTDIVINAAVRRSTFPKSTCEFIITKEDLSLMKPNSILCDATACDNDYIETAISSESLSDWYKVDGVVHYNCDHIPSLVANTATQLLTTATYPYIRLLADNDFEGAVGLSQPLYKGASAYKGRLTHQYSAVKKGMEFSVLEELL
jgi:alanine dehydrogenase